LEVSAYLPILAALKPFKMLNLIWSWGGNIIISNALFNNFFLVLKLIIVIGIFKSRLVCGMTIPLGK
jgi:hypothetical protein